MTKPCPPELEAFKHEPADYERPKPRHEPTRVCVRGSGFSSATGGFTALTIDGKRYSANEVGEAIAAWNTRTQANAAMREALDHWDAQATCWLESREQHARPGWMQPAIDKGRRALSGDRA